jgi:hypothetical protein
MEHAPLRPVPARPAGPIDPARALREVAGRLPAISPLAGRALALVVLAEQPRAEVAASLGVSEPELGLLLAEARKELRQTLVPLGGSGWCERAERLISDRLDGELTEADAPRLDVHLRNCPRCVEHERRLVQATDALIGGLSAPAAPVPAAPAPLAEAPEAEDGTEEMGAADAEPGPGEPAADDALPGEGGRDDAPAREAAPDDAPPGQAAPDDAPPGQAAPDDAPPGQAAPDDAPPGEAAPDDAPAREAAPDDAPPGEAASQDRAPKEAALGERSPDGSELAADDIAAGSSGDQIAAAAEVLVAVRTRRQIAAAVVWNGMIAIAVLLTLATIALTIAGILGAKL